MTIYTTNDWKGYGKQDYYWNEYRLKGNTIYKYKCTVSNHLTAGRVLGTRMRPSKNLGK